MGRPKLHVKCTVEGCERDHKAKGFCWVHYNRFKRYGSTDDPKPTPQERFHNCYTLIPETTCWIWTGHVIKNGYGRIRVNGEYVLAHRLSWKLYRGPIPEGMCVCHHCDEPSCVNPEHLFLGTHKDNMDDAVKKGRLNPKEYVSKMPRINGRFAKKEGVDAKRTQESNA